jgi:hypothetical protein
VPRRPTRAENLLAELGLGRDRETDLYRIRAWDHASAERQLEVPDGCSDWQRRPIAPEEPPIILDEGPQAVVLERALARRGGVALSGQREHVVLDYPVAVAFEEEAQRVRRAGCLIHPGMQWLVRGAVVALLRKVARFPGAIASQYCLP